MPNPSTVRFPGVESRPLKTPPAPHHARGNDPQMLKRNSLFKMLMPVLSKGSTNTKLNGALWINPKPFNCDGTRPRQSPAANRGRRPTSPLKLLTAPLHEHSSAYGGDVRHRRDASEKSRLTHRPSRQFQRNQLRHEARVSGAAWPIHSGWLRGRGPREHQPRGAQLSQWPGPRA